MASSYFTVPSFARAKKNKEDLEKTNPLEPVLSDEDQKFFDKQVESEEAAKEVKDAPVATITDDGEEKEATKDEATSADNTDQAIVPETQPESGETSQPSEDQTTTEAQPDETPQPSGDQSYDDVMKEKAAERVKQRKAKKSQSMDLPSQEEAEAATRGFNEQSGEGSTNTSGQKRTWASYLPSVRPSSKKSSDQAPKEGEETKDGEITYSPTDQRTWTQYASSYVPTIATWKSKSKDADAAAEPVYNEDGSINEEETREKQEREVSVLLDNLNMSAINNRVFAFSAETQKYYERFALVLKDIINGVPTAYDDMDKLMKEAGPKLEEQFKSMPPFVQTLVKSLPMRLGSTLGPELMAAASEKPGNDMNAKLAAASKHDADASADAAAAGTAGVDFASTSEKTEDGTKKKQKRRIPGLKGLVSQKGTVAGMLRSVVNFLQTRFPFLASTTNVVMSLAVFSKSYP